VEYFGHDALVSLKLRSGESVRARVLGAVPSVGQAVSVTVDGEARAFGED
jgi:hypothetical protein